MTFTSSKPVKLLLCICVILSLFLPLSTAFALKTDTSEDYVEIIVCGNSDCEPIELYFNGQYVGAMPELFEILSEQTRLHFTYLENTSEDVYALAESGQYDILSAVSTDEQTLQANCLIPGPVCFSYNGVDYTIAYTKRVSKEYIALINSSIEALPESARTLGALKAVEMLSRMSIPMWIVGAVLILNAVCIALVLLILLYNKRRKTSFQTDELTGLENKAGLIAICGSLKRKRQLPLYMLAYIALDLEKLWSVFGQEEANEYIQKTANLLKENLKDSWFAARLDNFGFGLAFPASSNEEAKSILQPVLARLYELLNVNRGSLKCEINAGVCRIDSSSTQLNKSIDTARLVASCAKERGSRLLFYSPELISKASSDYRTAKDVLASINLDAFEIYVLPQVDPRSTEIVSAQALVRWMHPQKGLLMPSAFMPAIENTEKIKDLDEHVFAEVCRWIQSRIEKNLAPKMISCNISSTSLNDPSFHERLKKYLELYKLPPLSIAVELESSMLDGGDIVADNIAKLSSYGVHIIIDNFGDENTSLLSLSKQNVDQVKLARKLMPKKTQDKETLERYVLLMSNAVGICKRLGLSVIVCGVEDELDHEVVKELDCDLAEGYYYFHPMPKAEFDKL